MKKPVTKDGVFDREPYHSILNLLMKFGNRGLEQKHFRYALIKDHDNLHPFSIKGMEFFFLDKEKGVSRLDALYKSRILMKNCITSRNNLTKFLNVLRGLRVISKYKRGKKKKYKIDKNFINEGIRHRNIQNIQGYSSDSLISYDLDYNIKHVIYGIIRDEEYDYFEKDEKDKVKLHLDEIEDHLKAIEQTKFEVANKRYDTKFKEAVYNCQNLEFTKFIFEEVKNGDTREDILTQILFGEIGLDEKCTKEDIKDLFSLEFIPEFPQEVYDDFKTLFIVLVNHFLKINKDVVKDFCDFVWDEAFWLWLSHERTEITFSRFNTSGQSSIERHLKTKK